VKYSWDYEKLQGQLSQLVDYLKGHIIGFLRKSKLTRFKDYLGHAYPCLGHMPYEVYMRFRDTERGTHKLKLMFDVFSNVLMGLVSDRRQIRVAFRINGMVFNDKGIRYLRSFKDLDLQRYFVSPLIDDPNIMKEWFDSVVRFPITDQIFMFMCQLESENDEDYPRVSIGVRADHGELSIPSCSTSGIEGFEEIHGIYIWRLQRNMGISRTFI
jgi:hypothetical protein